MDKLTNEQLNNLLTLADALPKEKWGVHYESDEYGTNARLYAGSLQNKEGEYQDFANVSGADFERYLLAIDPRHVMPLIQELLHLRAAANNQHYYTHSGVIERALRARNEGKSYLAGLGVYPEQQATHETAYNATTTELAVSNLLKQIAAYRATIPTPEQPLPSTTPRCGGVGEAGEPEGWIDAVSSLSNPINPRPGSLPQLDEKVQVELQGGTRTIGQLTWAYRWLLKNGTVMLLHEVVRWQPLPAAPKSCTTCTTCTDTLATGEGA